MKSDIQRMLPKPLIRQSTITVH